MSRRETLCCRLEEITVPCANLGHRLGSARIKQRSPTGERIQGSMCQHADARQGSRLVVWASTLTGFMSECRNSDGDKGFWSAGKVLNEACFNRLRENRTHKRKLRLLSCTTIGFAYFFPHYHRPHMTIEPQKAPHAVVTIQLNNTLFKLFHCSLLRPRPYSDSA